MYWHKFPDDKPTKNGSYLAQLWDGLTTVARWRGGRWTLYRPAAVVRWAEFKTPPELSKAETEERKKLLDMCEDEELRELLAKVRIWGRS
jgi:hypothetical protein